jgi:hypothetical protein
MSAINRICFDMIAYYFQEIYHSCPSDDERGIIFPNQKDFIRDIKDSADYISKITRLLSHQKPIKDLFI